MEPAKKFWNAVRISSEWFNELLLIFPRAAIQIT